MAKVFRKQLEENMMFMHPCVYDALSAVLIDQAGFKIIGTTGYSIASWRSAAERPRHARIGASLLRFNEKRGAATRRGESRHR